MPAGFSSLPEVFDVIECVFCWPRGCIKQPLSGLLAMLWISVALSWCPTLLWISVALAQLSAMDFRSGTAMVFRSGLLRLSVAGFCFLGGTRRLNFVPSHFMKSL